MVQDRGGITCHKARVESCGEKEANIECRDQGDHEDHTASGQSPMGVSRKISLPISGTMTVTLHGKRDFAEVEECRLRLSESETGLRMLHCWP
jgi:hypothetical protein